MQESASRLYLDSQVTDPLCNWIVSNLERIPASHWKSAQNKKHNSLSLRLAAKQAQRTVFYAASYFWNWKGADMAPISSLYHIDVFGLGRPCG